MVNPFEIFGNHHSTRESLALLDFLLLFGVDQICLATQNKVKSAPIWIRVYLSNYRTLWCFPKLHHCLFPSSAFFLLFLARWFCFSHHYVSLSQFCTVKLAISPYVCLRESRRRREGACHGFASQTLPALHCCGFPAALAWWDQVSERVWSAGVDERVDLIPGPTDDSPGVPKAGN